MSKKSYVAYSMGLILCLCFGAVWTLQVLFIMGYSDSYAIALIGNLLAFLPFVSAAILSFFFTKKALLSMEKDAFAPIFLWNVAVLGLSMIPLVLLFGEVLDILFLAVLFYIAPCVLCSVASIVIYSHQSNRKEHVATPSRKRAILSQFGLFFVPASLLILCDVVTILMANGSIMMLLGGIRSPFLLAVTFASWVYARGATKRLGKFPLENLIINFTFAALSSLLLYFYARAIDIEIYYGFLASEFGWVFMIIMTLVPPICFSINATISLYLEKRKAKKQAVNEVAE